MEKLNESQRNFISQLNDPDKIVRISGLKINGPLTITKEKFNCLALIVTDCIFDLLFLDDITINIGLSFHSCEFSDLYLKNIVVEGPPDVFMDNDTSINIQKCNIKRNLSIDKNCRITKDLNIGNSTIKNFGIFDLSSSMGGIKILSTEIYSLLNFNNIQVLNEIKFCDCIVGGEIKLSNNKASSIEFLGNNFFKDDTSLTGGALKKGLIFNDGIYEKPFRIKGIDGGDDLILVGSNFNDSVEIQFFDENNVAVGFQKIYISASAFKMGLSIKGTEAVSQPFFYLNQIYLDFSARLTGTIAFNGFASDLFKICGSNFNASLIIKESWFCNFQIMDFSNYNNIQFIGCRSFNKSESSLYIYHSYLGKTQFINFDFESFRSLTIVNSFLAEIITSNISWFFDEKLTAPISIYRDSDFNDIMRLPESNLEWAMKKEIYRQLKLAMEKHGNRTDALIFQQHEMKAYERQLRYSKKRSFQDWIILLTNYSNDHGQNWWRPIWLGALITFIFYIAIIISASNEYHLVLTLNLKAINNTLIFLWDEIGLFFQLFNPARNLGTIFRDRSNFTLTRATHFWDMSQRIFVSYFIFQTVSAFRKFSKN